MTLKETSPNNLHDRTERAQAKLARIARGDCWHGGAKAMVIAERLDRMGAQFDAGEVVADAYTDSRGNATRFLAYACPECGSACFGADAAYACCAGHEEF